MCSDNKYYPNAVNNDTKNVMSLDFRVILRMKVGGMSGSTNFPARSMGTRINLISVSERATNALYQAGLCSRSRDCLYMQTFRIKSSLHICKRQLHMKLFEVLLKRKHH